MIEDLGTKIKQTGNARNNIFDMFKKNCREKIYSTNIIM